MIRDSASAVLAVVDGRLPSEGKEEDEEEEEDTLGNRVQVAAFYTVRSFISSACGTKFVSRVGERNSHSNNGSKEKVGRTNEWEELLSPEANYGGIINGLCHRGICLFHARAPACPIRVPVPKDDVACRTTRTWFHMDFTDVGISHRQPTPTPSCSQECSRRSRC